MGEEKIREHYLENEMKTPVHLSVGGEAIVAGVCQALQPTDQVFGTYRSHGLYLAKTQETDQFFAELYGKNTGGAKGKAGSMHLTAPEYGLMGTSAVVATTIPLAVGTAFSNVYKKNGKMTAVFFGDGAIDEGVFWESLNLACLKKLPILFICENNNLAIHTDQSLRHGYDNIADIVSKFHCNVLSSDSTDAEEIYNLTKTATNLFQENKKPAFLHLKYYRYYEHVGINYDFDAGYRSEDEYKEWQKRDPISLQRKKLLSNGYLESDITDLENSIIKKIEASIKKAQEAPYPDKAELYTDVFSK